LEKGHKAWKGQSTQQQMRSGRKGWEVILVCMHYES